MVRMGVGWVGKGGVVRFSLGSGWGGGVVFVSWVDFIFMYGTR